MPYMCTAYSRLHRRHSRTVGVVWVCRRFDYSHFCCRFGVTVLTIDRYSYAKSAIIMSHMDTSVDIILCG